MTVPGGGPWPRRGRRGWGSLRRRDLPHVDPGRGLPARPMRSAPQHPADAVTRPGPAPLVDWGGEDGGKVDAERPAPTYGGTAARAAPAREHRAGDTNRLTRQALGAGC